MRVLLSGVTIAAIVGLANAAAMAQERPAAPAPALPPAPPPAEVTRMLEDISPERVKGYVETLAGFGTRHTLSDTTSDVRGIGAARRWIKAEFERIAQESGRTGERAMRVYFDSYAIEPDGRRVDVPTELVNVIAELPGRLEATGQAERCYVLGHYDSRRSDVMDREGEAPGANDDASGVAVVIELARVMSRHEYDHTIVFMATAGEEQGLLGARRHFGRLVEQGAPVRAVFNNDIVGDPTAPSGARHDTRVRVFSEGLPAIGERGGAMTLERLRREGALAESSSRQLARLVAMVAEWHKLPVQAMLVFRADRFLRGGDHLPFHEAGFAAVRFCEVEEDYTRQHQDLRTEDGVRYGDTPEFVDGRYLAGVAAVNGAALAHVANAPQAPSDARIVTAQLSNATTLRWSPSPEPDTAGYEVVWRETTSPQWQWSMDVGPRAEATLDVSKDNFFFGVRAYDSEGYRSPVVFPLSVPQ